MLKILNILGYISLLSLLYFIFIFILSFDLFLQILNMVFILIFIIVNFIFFRKKKYLGIRCFVIIIMLFILSFATYNIYTIIRGNIFKNKINEIYDGDKYVPDKLVIDIISKGGASIKAI